jgi:hypothetical protein
VIRRWLGRLIVAVCVPAAVGEALDPWETSAFRAWRTGAITIVILAVLEWAVRAAGETPEGAP